MIFRRTLVRELTATAIGLFVVLSAILFTNLVLRLLARAAGGAVAPDGILALLGFNALFYLNVLLAVALFLTVLLTLSRWYRDSEMIVWMTSGQSLTALLKPILWFPAPFLVAIVALSLFLSPWAEQRKLEFERQLETRDELAFVTPGLFREFPRAQLVVFLESINTFDGTIRNVFLHSIDERKDVTTLARSGRSRRRPTARATSCSRTAGATKASPAAADFRIVEFERLGRVIEPARRARCRCRARRSRPTRCSRSTATRARRAVLATVGADPRVRADAARDPAVARQPAPRPLVQPVRRGVPLHALHELPQHRAEPDRAGEARLLGRAGRAARDRGRRGHSAVPPPARAVRLSGWRAARRPRRA